MKEATAAFQCADIPWNESQRLRALRRYGLLDADPEVRFDRLTSLTSRLLNTPIALVSLVDANRQFFMSRQGLEAHETSRDLAFCAHAIHGDGIFEIPDATQDPRFAGNPLVVGPPHIRYYIGKPLVDREGFRLGTLCAIDLTARPPLDADGRAILTDLAAAVVDLIEMRQTALEAETERQRTQRLMEVKEAYLATMAHELRTPLNAVTGFGQLLKMTGADDCLSDKQREYLNMIVESGEYLTMLVGETLDAEAREAGPGAMRSEPVPLAPALAGAARLLAPLAVKRDVTLSVDAPQDLCVWGDPLRLRQVLINLVSNAVKYNRAGGSVTLRAAMGGEEGDKVTIQCRDSGVGIPAREIPNLFRAFHRVPETSEDVEGTGLGLRITRRLVRMMGGAIQVQSREGEGSTFTVTLDRAAPD
ncbi:GAF domain-containing sensor histidine kinase [Roseospira navarrensis]|nr:GAF domain-containing sensor histidine kinase [Roseospira navarrensis]